MNGVASVWSQSQYNPPKNILLQRSTPVAFQKSMVPSRCKSKANDTVNSSFHVPFAKDLPV